MMAKVICQGGRREIGQAGGTAGGNLRRSSIRPSRCCTNVERTMLDDCASLARLVDGIRGEGAGFGSLDRSPTERLAIRE